jgi:hypothetical protein
MIQIENLTQDQVEMLDIMWSLDTMEDYFEWYNTLNVTEQKQADTLQRMLVISEIDNLITEDLSQAKHFLKDFML